MTMKRVIGRIVLLALLVYVLWAAWLIVRFERYESPSVSPAGGALTEIEGVYHVHSKNSDGFGTVDRIVRTAARAGLDFIILTDHGNPNFAALDAQGRKNGVLVLAGSEISSNRGHLIALGFDRPEDSFRFSSDAEIAAREISERGGFSIVAHPYSKVRWSWGEGFDYSGLEIIDADSVVKARVVRSLPYYPLILVKPTLAFLKMIVPPARALGKWDQLLGRAPANGYYSADAHLLYRAVFPVFHLHVFLEQPLAAEFTAASRQIFAALASGRFFSAVDGAAAARGFRISLDGGSLRVSAPFSFAHEIVIVRDGRVIQRTRENELVLPLPAPGAYRAEVYLRERTPLDAGTPWIISNPVYYRNE